MKNTFKKTPTIFQMEATECGAASLAMILSYYGKFVPLEKLRVDCGVSRDGSNAKNILRGARKHGLKAKGFKKGLEALIKSEKPSIIHWDFDHFVVYEGCKNNYCYINDPAQGRRKITKDELGDGFTGIVLEFEKDDNFIKSKNQKNLFYYIKQRVEGEKASILYLVLIGICLIIPGLVVPIFSKVFIDDILLGGNTDWFKGLIIAMVSMSILQSLLIYVQSSFLLKLQTKMSLVSSYKFVKKLFKLPIQFFEQRYAGDISGRVDSNDQVANFLAGDLTSTALSAMTATFYLIILIMYNIKLTLIGISFAFFNILFLKLTSEKVSTKKMKMEQDEGKMEGVLYSGLRIINSLKASGAENHYLERLLGYYGKTCKNEQELGSFKQYMSAIPSLTNQLTDVIILIIGGLEVIKGNMSVGTLIAFNSLMKNFIAPVNSLISFGERIQDLKVHMSRLNDINEYENDDKFKDFDSKVLMEKIKLDGYIEVKDMEFGYSILENPLIKNFSFKIQPGRSIAFVGPSGSGKSTISKVVSGLYQPWSGEILFDGVNKKRIFPEILNNSISVVSQDIVLFSGTIKDNITLWDDTIPKRDIINAAKDACLHDVITSKPGGYEFKVNEGGSNFSGGQRQRIEIARALALNPTIMILDEATSALDPKTEKEVLDNIRKRGCTCIIVAHRLSAIRDCDEIIVMNYGELVQRGTHDELRDIDGHYKKLISLNG